MAFSLTTPMVLDRSKTVTRRTGWRFLKPGDLVQAVEKSRGLKKGEPVRELAILRIVDVRVESLARLLDDPRYAEDELPREGYPCWSRDEWVQMFCRTHGLKTPRVDVTRIAFEYAEGAETRRTRREAITAGGRRN